MSTHDFAGAIFAAESSHNSKYYSPGDFISVIRNVIAKNTKNGRPMVLFETEIQQTTSPEHAIGTAATQCYMQDTDAGPGNTRSAIRDILGITDAQLNDEAGKAAIIKCLTPDEETGKSPLAGVVIRVHAVNRPTRKGTDFTHTTLRRAEDGEQLPAHLQRFHGSLPSVATNPNG